MGYEDSVHWEQENARHTSCGRDKFHLHGHCGWGRGWISKIAKGAKMPFCSFSDINFRFSKCSPSCNAAGEIRDISCPILVGSIKYHRVLVAAQRPCRQIIVWVSSNPLDQIHASCQWKSLCVIFHSSENLRSVKTSDARLFTPASLPDQR